VVERCPDKTEVEGSIPSTRIMKKLFIIILYGWLVASTLFVFAAVNYEPKARAIVLMSLIGLVLVWITLLGGLMYFGRARFKIWLDRWSLAQGKKFFFFATGLALLEEAITTLMSNLAPAFGVKVGEAYLTASTNYLDVIFLHSVIVFLPSFLVWTRFLKRYSFTPFSVFLTFGITGLIMEAGTFGLQHLAEFGLWIFVYGLMVYLPAFVVYNPVLPKPLWRHYFYAIFFSVLGGMIVAGLIYLFFSGHPANHFIMVL
ncbi:MAG: hypothetical protein AAB453_03690, partial [Patescibacteria group bacterium]